MKLKFLLSTAVLALLVTQNVFAEKLPLETFFKKPQFASLQISPNGKELAVLAPINGRMNVVVMDLATRKPKPVTGHSEQDVTGFSWANNERILYYMDKNGSESFGIFAINTDGSMHRTLVPPLDAQIGDSSSRIQYAFVLDLLRDEPDYILVSTNERRAAYPDVYKMNIYNKRDKKLVQRNSGNVTNWITDWDGNVVGAGFQEELEVGVLLLNDSGEWEEIVRSRYDEPSFSPAGINGDGPQGYVVSNINPDGSARDKAALYHYNFDTRQFGELIYEHPVVDCCGLIQNRKKRDMIGVVHAVGIPEQVYLDERWKRIMDGINQALPDSVNGFSSIDDEESIGVVVSYTSQQPPRYYLFDFEKNSLEWLVDSRPWIKPEQMAKIKPIEFTSRDGRSLHGYLTVPVGSEGKNLPMIMHPHGGPWARDGWGFNPEIQFLANRGYAVLQVNFRGSTGFGMDHLNSSKKQWGRTMQNDVTDAVMWAIGEGIADKDRVCIYGASYGGYATMAGLTYTPDLYRCGINYVGVTDIPLLSAGFHGLRLTGSSCQHQARTNHGGRHGKK